MNHPTSSLKSLLTRDCIGFAILFTAATGFGFLANQFRDQPMSLAYQSKEQRLEAAVNHLQEAESTTVPGGKTLPDSLGLSEFQTVVSQNEALILDARPEIFHRLGHIPGAYSLPRESFEEAYIKLKPVLEPYKSRPVVVYCSSASCEDSKLVKKALRSMGFQQVAVFTGGWAEWTDARLPEEQDS